MPHFSELSEEAQAVIVDTARGEFDHRPPPKLSEAVQEEIRQWVMDDSGTPPAPEKKQPELSRHAPALLGLITVGALAAGGAPIHAALMLGAAAFGWYKAADKLSEPKSDRDET